MKTGQTEWNTPCVVHIVPTSLLCLLSSGASFTRFQTLRLQKIFPESLANQLISYGSCQFPTLGFVVERFKAIQSFIPETFYKIKGTNCTGYARVQSSSFPLLFVSVSVLHRVEEDTVEFSWKRNRLFNHTACLVLYQICMEVRASLAVHRLY